MKLLLLALLILVTPRALSQQQHLPAANPPVQQMPPDTTAPPPTQPAPVQMSSLEIEKQIQKAFDQDASLVNSKLKVSVDDMNITLTGSVENQKQHDLALQLAQAYAGKRKIVDNIIIHEKT